MEGAGAGANAGAGAGGKFRCWAGAGGTPDRRKGARWVHPDRRGSPRLVRPEYGHLRRNGRRWRPLSPYFFKAGRLLYIRDNNRVHFHSTPLHSLRWLNLN